MGVWNDLGWWIDLSEVMRNFGLVIAGGLGLLIAWRRVRAANRQADASLEQAVTARSSHAVEVFNVTIAQLGHDKLEMRLGAILTLRQISSEHLEFRHYVVQVLTAYLRGRHTVANLDRNRLPTGGKLWMSCAQT